MSDLTGKVVLITGGSNGIGAAIVKAFAAQGALVAFTYGHNAGPANALVETLGGPDKALAVQSDAGDLASFKDLIKAVVDKFGKIDVLIPNAGIMPMADIEHITPEILDNVLNVNLKGPIFLAQAALPHMAPGSNVILVSTSLTAMTNFHGGYLPYMASKGAIEQVVRVLAKDLAKKGITVNAYAPGPTATELFVKGKSEEFIDTLKKLSPFEKLGTPEDIADVVVGMAGDKARWLSGQTIRVNGAIA